MKTFIILAIAFSALQCIDLDIKQYRIEKKVVQKPKVILKNRFRRFRHTRSNETCTKTVSHHTKSCTKTISFSHHTESCSNESNDWVKSNSNQSCSDERINRRRFINRRNLRKQRIVLPKKPRVVEKTVIVGDAN